MQCLYFWFLNGWTKTAMCWEEHLVVIKNDTSSYFAPRAQREDYIYAIFAQLVANLSSSNWLEDDFDDTEGEVHWTSLACSLEVLVWLLVSRYYGVYSVPHVHVQGQLTTIQTHADHFSLIFLCQQLRIIGWQLRPGVLFVQYPQTVLKQDLRSSPAALLTAMLCCIQQSSGIPYGRLIGTFRTIYNP